MTKIQILSSDRAEVRLELAEAGIPTEGVADLGYEGQADALPNEQYLQNMTARQANQRTSGMTGRDMPTEGLDHRAPKPSWLRVKAPTDPKYLELKDRVKSAGLNTVCEEAACPNIGDCWASGHLTTMILGDTCTRGCAFCNIKTGKPNAVNADEPAELAKMASELGIKHMVITSVDRDDLPDGGTGHWAACIEAIRAASPDTTIEILTPDFRRKEDHINTVADARPDVYNHNLETVPRLYKTVRPGARYFGSLRLLQAVKERHPSMFTKSGLMVGLGETREEVLQVMDDLRAADVDFLTIGQYLRPSPQHYPIMEYVTPEQFADYETQAKRKGFTMVASGPLVRSSFHADAYFAELVEARAAKLGNKKGA